MMDLSSQDVSLRDLALRTEYRSDQDDLIRDFYFPCLSRSRRYCRAVGFFTSQSLSLAASGVVALIRNGGNMCLVASPLLAEEDIEAIQQGYQARQDVITKALL